MFLARDLADSFGDRLEGDRIRRALVAALPERREAITHGGLRPLLTIRRQEGRTLLVARSHRRRGRVTARDAARPR